MNLRTRNLSVSYGARHPLRDVSLEVREGEFVAIIGRSGSGKTTLLSALAGHLSHTGTKEVPERIGIVFQKDAVFPWLTAAENIAFGLPKERAQTVTKEHLRLAGLEAEGARYPATLSGGQVQRIAVARALAHDPDLLLMDEPYGALDAHTRARMQQWLLEVWEMTRKTVLFVTHDIEEALFLADRILVLDDGGRVSDYAVSLPRPRRQEVRSSEDFIRAKTELSARIGGRP